jgi:hypothetical protein
MAYNTSGWILAVSRNVARTNNALQKWWHLPPEMTGLSKLQHYKPLILVCRRMVDSTLKAAIVGP